MEGVEISLSMLQIFTECKIMKEDPVKKLVEKAHKIFNKTSIYEVMDLERDDAIQALTEYYGPCDTEKLNKYFAILDQLRE